MRSEMSTSIIKSSTRLSRRSMLALALAASAGLSGSAFGGTSTNSSGTAGQAGINPAVTITLSGSTAMRNFTIGTGITLLTPNTASVDNSITLNTGVGGASVTYTAPNLSTTSFQLASGNFTSADTHSPIGGPAVTGPWPSTDPLQTHSAIRLEWHEQGSVEGILELVNDQIAPLTTVGNTNRNPSSGNPIWINRNSFDASTGPKSAGGTQNGLAVGQFYATANATSGQGVYDNVGGIGVNRFGGTNAIQMAISDVNATQGFSKSGASGAFALAPGASGYGKGNPALAQSTTSGLGVAGARQALEDQTLLNMGTTTRDPRTGAATDAAGTNFNNGVAGPWNTAGTGNLSNTTIAHTATLLAANPGTGLERVSRTDAQWLQTTGRLKNGADFNVASRDVNSGTRNTAALNTGVDPSFATGELDSGSGLTAQAEIGPNIRFSNKTAGGGQLRPTIQNSRMALGTLGLSDALTASTSNGVNGGTDSRPIRGLDYSDDGVTYVRASAASITDGSYKLFQNQTYVTVKKVSAAFQGDSVATWSARTDLETGIQGDNTGNDVRDFRANITKANAQFPVPASSANPADQLLNASFIVPSLMAVKKDVDGGPLSANPTYDSNLRDAFLANSIVSKFAVGGVDQANGGPGFAPSTITKGTGSNYGNKNTVGTAIPITTNNYLFGDFDKRTPSPTVSGSGVRDFSDIDVARRAQAAMGTDLSMFSVPGNNASPLNSTNNNTVSNATFTEIGNGFAGTGGSPTRGDLIVMGDFNSDGAFDGEDLRRMARGTSLADSASSSTLINAAGPGASFADNVRSASAVLRKNGALDQLHAGPLAANSSQKAQARAVLATDPGIAPPSGATTISTTGAGATLVTTYTLDPAGANAFNKFDVSRDGVVDREDFKIVETFDGSNYTVLQDQLDAVVQVTATGAVVAFADASGKKLSATDVAYASIRRAPFSLVDAELNDNGAITHVLSGGTSDAKLIHDELVALGKLRNGDANTDGIVNIDDLSTLAQNYNLTSKNWAYGDFNFDGLVNIDDLSILAQNYNLTSLDSGLDVGRASFAADFGVVFGAGAAVPEPASLGLVAGSAGLLLIRRRRFAGI